VSAPIDVRQCTRPRCLDAHRELAQIYAVIGPGMSKDGDSALAVASLIGKATELLKERNHLRMRLQKVRQLWMDARAHNAGIVLEEELAAALYHGEDISR
jgi:hypothetical protein